MSEYWSIDIPFEHVLFDKMNKKQAQQYFDWFMDTLEDRIACLQKFINEEGGEFVLDKTPESLIPLWEWFQPRIELCPKTEEELQKEIAECPERWRFTISENRFTIQTFAIAWDIAAYFGEVVVANNPQIHWGYLSKPKKLYGVNRPRLLGFAGDMSAYTYGKVETCMRQDLKEPDVMRLRELYDICMKMM